MAKRKITHQYFGDDDDQPKEEDKQVQEPQEEEQQVEEPVYQPVSATLRVKKAKVVQLRSASDDEDDEPEAGPSTVQLPYAGPSSSSTSPKSKKVKRQHLRDDDDGQRRKRLQEAKRLEEGRMKLPFWEGACSVLSADRSS